MSNKTTVQINVPDVGESGDLEIIEVHIKPGERIEIDDPLITLESDKAAMDVPASQAGTVQSVSVNVGDKVSRGSLILLLESDDASAATDKAPESNPSTESTSAPQDSDDPPAAVKKPDTEVSAPLAGFDQVHASPVVRALARELDVNLNLVTATGTKARVTRGDVEAYARGGGNKVASSVGAETGTISVSPAAPVDFNKFGETQLSPLSNIKQLTAKNLHRSWVTIPHVTHHDETDITQTEAFRKDLKARAEKAGVRITLLAFFIKAAASALKEFPAFNSSLAADGQNLILKNYYNIGVAVDTPNGLVVPVIREVDSKSLFTISAELAELSTKARDRKLRTENLQGGCFTISSLGGIGGTSFTPIINAPEVAILGLTRSKLQPVPKGESFEFRLMQPMSLSYDHRVIDGAEAARFVKRLGELVNDLRLLLL